MATATQCNLFGLGFGLQIPLKVYLDRERDNLRRSTIIFVLSLRLERNTLLIAAFKASVLFRNLNRHLLFTLTE